MKKLIFVVLICLVLNGCKSDIIDEISEPDVGGAVLSAPPESAAPETTPSLRATPPTEGNFAEPFRRPARLLNCEFHEQREFDIFVSRAEIYDIQGNSGIISGVIPHHLLAGRLIAGFFKTVSVTRPDVETVIIVAPIHDAEGIVVATTLSDWAAPFGVLENEQGFSERFVDVLDAEICDDTVEKDHSASSLVPFIKYYFPEASVAVLLVEANAPRDFSERASALLARFAEEKNCLFVFSVDFSHYLGPEQIYERDEESRLAILEADTEKIARMTNANVDSPKSILAFLGLNELLSLELYELDNTNSLEISGVAYPHPIYDEGLTSYFVFAGVE